MKNFEYNGLKVKPLRHFSPRETFFYVTKRCNSIRMGANRGWDWDQFYQKANQAKCGNIDVFLVNGRQVVPCKHELFEYDND